MHGSEEDPVVPAVAGDDPSTNNAAITPTPAIMVTGDLMSHSRIFATQSTTFNGGGTGEVAPAQARREPTPLRDDPEGA